MNWSPKSTYKNLICSAIFNRYRSDLIFVLISRILLFGSGIISSVVIARYLGPEGKGILTAVFVVPTLLLSFGDLGVRQATTHLIGKKIYPEHKIIQSLLLIYVLSSLVTVTVSSLIYYYGPARNYDIKLLLLAVLTIPALLFSTYSRGIALGVRRVKKALTIELSNQFIYLFGLLLFLPIAGLGVSSAAGARLLGAVTGCINSLSLVQKGLDKNKIINIEPKLIVNMLKLGISFSVVLFLLSLNYRVDILVLERMASSVEIGIYSVGVQIAELLWQIPMALNVLIFSYSATDLSQLDSIRRVSKLLKYSLIVAIILGSLIYLISPFLIELLYGNQFQDSVTVTRILMPGVLAALVFKLLHADLAARGKPMAAFLVFLCTALLNIILNIILIPKYSINGVAFASTITYCLGALVYRIQYHRINKQIVLGEHLR
jgi:O-antigen/teichoic acid export membrane protein